MITALKRAKYAVTSRVSLATRVALITTVAMTMTLGSVSIIIYLTVRAEFESSMDDSLLRRAVTAVEDGAAEDLVAGIQSHAWDLADVRVAAISRGMLFADADSPMLVRYIGVPEREVAAGVQTYSIRSVRLGENWYRVVAVDSGPGTALVVAQSLESTRHALDRLAFVLIVTSFAGIAVAGLTGWAVATRGLDPVRRLTKAAERIARTEDLTPIPVTGGDELARLTSSFNTMLLALDASQTRQRQLVADAGHELRTPLTSLRTNIELLAQVSHTEGRSLTDRERDELLADVEAQITELTTLVGDLVELARDEPIAPHLTTLDLGDVVTHALRRVQRRASDVTFDVAVDPWFIEGEPVLLERAVMNLLDNAAKWSPDTGTVTVRLHDGTLTVDDQGPGISAEDLPHVFERFYRAAEARTQPGSGLGLSIVRRAAERHGGTVSADNAPGGGARFTMRLPGSADAGLSL